MADELYPWLPLADCLAQCGVAPGAANAPEVERARVATAAHVERMRPDLAVADVDPLLPAVYTPGADVIYGATLLVARLISRKGSPAGVAAYAEFAASVLRTDPDAERLLGLGRYAKPRIR